jgi:transposase
MDKSKLTPSVSGDQPKVYSKEFKLQAVARLRECTNATALADELGVKRNQLYKWSKQLEKVGVAGAFKKAGRPPLEAEDELTRLRRENKRLEMENAILKKADAYFARPKR